jgi:S-methylmethionine-dependent homocysteine/selenocysteine methylase
LETLVSDHRPDRVMLNCSRPEAVSQGLPILARLGLPFGAYANGFTRIDPRFNKIGATTDLLTARDDVGPERYAEFAAAWVRAGASTVGGCCEIGPAHIAELALLLQLSTARDGKKRHHKAEDDRTYWTFLDSDEDQGSPT